MQVQALEGAFTNAPVENAVAFRAAMNALARPGQIETISGANPPAPLSVAAGSLILTLCDAETPVSLSGPCNTQVIREWIIFHTGAPIVSPDEAQFALGTWQSLTPLSQFAIGTAQYPDRSATLVVERDELEPNGETLTGPGIKTSAQLSLPDIHSFQQNASMFPLGLDFFFTAGTQVAALPRTTKVDR